ncbi:ribose-5-phosphate isomerase RpiA [Pallidibacillus thermolactis]|uniref:ribose-5-phosphate isomerase RpiA n=1 Tax=Pallidibacillus thermolactis TaxID=251051 RepID=UPI00295368A8|nr:ribose-5-phosphate isomerase RpiA [Pallidibacillus thermolactis]
MYDIHLEKKIAGEKAVEFIEDGMTIGLGTGSTVYWFIQKLGELVSKGLNVKGIPTSKNTEQLARSLGIPIVSFQEIDNIHVAIDGADEVDEKLNAIKGGGGALVREKIIAEFADQFIIVVDQSKCSKQLGNHFLPVEVTPFGWQGTANNIAAFGCEVKLRQVGNKTFISDNNNYILDCYFKKINDASLLHQRIKMLTGVVDTGLFIDLADMVIVGKGNETEIIKKFAND